MYQGPMKTSTVVSEYLYSVNISRTELALAPNPAVIESPRPATTLKNCQKKNYKN